MLLQVLFFVLSITFVDCHHCVFLRNDCTLYVVEDCGGFDFGDNNALNNDCRNAHMQQLAWLDHQYLIIAANPSESTLKMNIVPLEVTGFENPKTITVQTVDFSHVIGYQCRFDANMFVMAVFERFLYFTIVCHNGAKIGLVKGVISQTGQWFIPYGSLSYSDINPRLYDGIFAHRTEKSEDVLIYGYKRIVILRAAKSRDARLCDGGGFS
uniref:Sema domain-containing protein n=1 Tax=Panagrellus redivivus TaxID=6233 RepID=A0A7E4VDN5_PANRE